MSFIFKASGSFTTYLEKIGQRAEPSERIQSW